MAAKSIIDKKVRWVLALIVVLVVALPILAVRSYIAKVTETKIVAASEPTDERLVAIDGRSMLVQPEALGQTMREWLKSKGEKTFSFELSDRSFVTGSTVPSRITAKRIDQVVDLAKASPALMVHILLPPHLASASVRQLDEQRALGLRNALRSDGVSAANVTIGVDQQDLPTTRTAQMAVLLSK